MQRHVFYKIVVFMILMTFVPCFNVFGESANNIKARMKSRIPVINTLKEKGVIGENNKGYLEFIGGVREREDVVQAENADREKIYMAIARQQGVAFAFVGKRRARRIAAIAPPGEWLQDERGVWHRK